MSDSGRHELWLPSLLFHFDRMLVAALQENAVLIRAAVIGSTLFRRESGLHQWGSADLFLNYPPLSFVQPLCQSRAGVREEVKEAKRRD